MSRVAKRSTKVKASKLKPVKPILHFLVETEMFEDDGSGSRTTRAVFPAMKNVSGYVADLSKAIQGRVVHVRISTLLNAA